MRKLFALLARPIVWSTGGLLILLLALHVVCPLLGIEDDKRWIIELLVGGPLAFFLVVYWVRQFLLDRRLTSDMATQAKRQAVQQGPDTVRDFKAFSEEFTRAFAELGRACRERGVTGGVSALPWILILGPSGVGKSTALERSGLRFTSLGRRLQGIGGTRNCTWWLASDSVFLDTAGRYAVRQEDREEWRAFLHLLRRRRRRPIDAMLLQVGIDELLERPRAEVERAALQLRERLDELSSLLQVQVPVHLLFNKCDLLDGFVEFFGSLDSEEQAQAWGFDLDTNSLTAQPLKEAFRARFAELVRALTERTTRRILGLSDPEAREAALGFPAELAGLAGTLGFFIETLFEPRARGERPWLCTIYLGSAEQTGQRLASLRQHRSEELSLNSAIRHRVGAPVSSTGAEGETYFLRGVFAQLIRQAEHAARPTAARQNRIRLHQRLAIVLTMATCVGGSAYLAGRYSGTIRWLGRLEDRAKQLTEAAALPRRAPRTTKEELLGELIRQDAVHDLLDDAPAGLPSGPLAAGSLVLRRRIEDQLLLPLQQQMQQDLERAASRQGTDPGEDFSRGFGMLRLSHVLRGKPCDGTDAELTSQSLAQYVLEHWQRALGDSGRFLALSGSGDEDGASSRVPSVALRRQVEFFFSQEPQALAASRLRFEDALLGQTRQALVDGSDDAGVVFNLRASLNNLYERSGQLSSPLLSESGVERAFTTRGCALFFSREASRGSEWWKCVLDRPLPKEPLNLEEVYRQKYADAWNRWLHDLSLRRTSPPPKSTSPHPLGESLPDAITALDSLVRDARPALTQVFAVVGRGRDEHASLSGLKKGKQPFYAGCGKSFGKSVDWGKQTIKAIKTPRECTGVMELVAPINQLSSKEKPTEEEAAEAAGVREDYQKYLAAAKALRIALNSIHLSTERNPKALKLVQDTMATAGELWALHAARNDLMDALQSKLAGNGLDFRDSGLNNALRDIEGMAWRALLPSAARALNEQWKNLIVSPWQTLKGNQLRQQPSDEDRCKQRMEFLRKDLAEFVTKSLAAFYVGNNLQQCNLKPMAAPFDHPLGLLSSACGQLRETRKVADEITDCPKALGPSGQAPKREIQKADVVPPPVKNCAFEADEVVLDRADKVYICPQSTGVCNENKDRKTSQHARVQIKWKGQYGYSTMFEKDSAEELFQIARTSGTKLLFHLPKERVPGKCEGFELTFSLAPAAAGSGAMPKGADNRWKTVDLPNNLLDR